MSEEIIKKFTLVTHITNKNIKLLVVDITDREDKTFCTCRWIDKNGVPQNAKYFREELKAT